MQNRVPKSNHWKYMKTIRKWQNSSSECNLCKWIMLRLPKPRISKTVVKGLWAAKISFRSKKTNSSFFSGLSGRVFLFVPWFEGFELDHFSMRFFPWVCASMRLVCAGKSRENKISWLFDNSFTRILAVQWFSIDKELRSGFMELYLPICGVLLFRFLTQKWQITVVRNHAGNHIQEFPRPPNFSLRVGKLLNF